MQNPEILNFPNSSEMEFYRYLAAAAAAGGGGGIENDVVGLMNNHHNKNYSKSNYSSSCSSFYPGSSGIMTETTDSKAIAASRILHKEAEKRRRERINSHLDRLRSLLPCTSKTDKATLLSKVVQRVLELKRQTSELPDLENLIIPSQNDEFAVYILHDHNQNDNHSSTSDADVIDIDNIDNTNNNHQQLILKASLCCEDRPDLLADLSQVLASLNMRPLRAEMSTLGGRIHGVLIVSPGDDNCRPGDECALFLRDALKGIVQRSASDDRLKRRRRIFVS